MSGKSAVPDVASQASHPGQNYSYMWPRDQAEELIIQLATQLQYNIFRPHCVVCASMCILNDPIPADMRQCLHVQQTLLLQQAGGRRPGRPEWRWRVGRGLPSSWGLMAADHAWTNEAAINGGYEADWSGAEADAVELPFIIYCNFR